MSGVARWLWLFCQRALARERSARIIVFVSVSESAPLEALVCVRTDPHTSPDRLMAYLREEPAVVQAWRVAADIDAVARLECATLAELDAAVGRMRHLGGAEHTVTYLVLAPMHSGG